VLFQIEDDGKGFDVKAVRQGATQKGMGLITMEERVRTLGGRLKIWSQKNQGTKLTFAIQIS